MDFELELRNIEKRIGSSPRKFGYWERFTKLRIVKPSWDWKNDDIAKIVINWEKVFSHGHLAWGQTIQVNSLLFEDGDRNHPGEILVDPIPNDDSITNLQRISNELFSSKGNSAQIDNIQSKEFAEYLENERIRVFGLKIPSMYGGKDRLFVSTVYFQRKHLLKHKILKRIMPVLYLKENPKIVVVVPYQYWTDKFREWWLE